MTQQNQQTPIVSPEVAFDRRYPNRENSNWVRQAFIEQNTKLEKVSTSIDELTAVIAQALPDNDPKLHYDIHRRLEQWEIQRTRDEEKREKEREEKKQFYTGIKQDIVRNAFRAGIVILIGLLVLGSQAKLKEWMISTVGVQTTQEVKK